MQFENQKIHGTADNIYNISVVSPHRGENRAHNSQLHNQFIATNFQTTTYTSNTQNSAMRFSTLCLQVIGLGGAATTASVFRDLQVFLATSQALLSISSKGAVSSSASCIPHGSDPLDGQTISRYMNGYTWTVSGGEKGGVVYATSGTRYLMGKFHRIEGNVAYYTQGDLCGSTPRSVVVTFNEDCSYENMQITSSAEPGLCSYTIGIKGVCYCTRKQITLLYFYFTPYYLCYSKFYVVLFLLA